MAEVHFDFAPGEKMTPEFRNARSLEFIAFYLDRIEGHLEQLARSSRTDVTLQRGLQEIATALRRK